MLPLGAFAAGLLAGLAIALPLGAIGVLLVREGVERGLRLGLAAAVGVAAVDFAYATVAVVLGSRVATALAGYERVVQVVGAAVLTVVVVLGVRRTVRTAAGQEPEGAGITDLPSVPAVFVRFVALTAVNPMTAVYFVALTAGLSSRLAGPGAGAAFAVGVLLGSLAWQVVLAASGALLGARTTPRVRAGTSLVGYAMVMTYALRLAIGT